MSSGPPQRSSICPRGAYQKWGGVAQSRPGPDLLAPPGGGAHGRFAGRTAGLQAARDVFYRGAIAQHIVAFSQRHAGLLELDDLATFRTR